MKPYTAGRCPHLTKGGGRNWASYSKGAFPLEVHRGRFSPHAGFFNNLVEPVERSAFGGLGGGSLVEKLHKKLHTVSRAFGRDNCVGRRYDLISIPVLPVQLVRNPCHTTPCPLYVDAQSAKNDIAFTWGARTLGSESLGVFYELVRLDSNLTKAIK